MHKKGSLIGGYFLITFAYQPHLVQYVVHNNMH